MALILIEIMEEYEPDYWGDNRARRGNGCGWILWLVVIVMGGKVGEIGFFDTISGKFYGNDGSGEFSEYVPS